MFKRFEKFMEEEKKMTRGEFVGMCLTWFFYGAAFMLSILGLCSVFHNLGWMKTF